MSSPSPPPPPKKLNSSPSTSISHHELVLYSYWRSSCSYRVRIALALKGIADYQYKSVHLVKDGGEQHKPEYVSENPMKQVPLLVYKNTDNDGNVHVAKISQSMAILEFLEETYSNPPLLPKKPQDRASVRKICYIITSDIQPVQNLRVMQTVEKLTNKETSLKWSKDVIHNGFIALEKELLSTAGKYCFGDSITFADICLVPQVYNAKRFNVNLSEFPTISRIYEALVELPEFISASPEKQPDAQ